MREALLMNLKGFSPAQLQETILVGLGVLFEEYYNSLDQTSKQHFLQSLSALL